MNKRVGIITQARMTSTRLPGKILMPIHDKPLLAYHLERLAQSQFPIFIATTTNATDDVVVDFANESSVGVWRGSEYNVLERYYQCAKANELDVIVRVTSDCPLIDGQLISQGIESYLEEVSEHVYLSNCVTRSYPRGFDFEIFSFRLLEDAFLHARLESDLEHVTPYIHQNRAGNVLIKNIVNTQDDSDIRITVDTPEDFALVKLLIEKFGADKLDHHEIISLFHHHPELYKINDHISQKII